MLVGAFHVHFPLSCGRRAQSALRASGRTAPLKSIDRRYAEDPKDKIAVSAGMDPEPSTGFLSACGGTDPENDFNVYAEKIFTEPQRVSELAKANALVGEKFALCSRHTVPWIPAWNARSQT